MAKAAEAIMLAAKYDETSAEAYLASRSEYKPQTAKLRKKCHVVSINLTAILARMAARRRERRHAERRAAHNPTGDDR